MCIHPNNAHFEDFITHITSTKYNTVQYLDLTCLIIWGIWWKKVCVCPWDNTFKLRWKLNNRSNPKIVTFVLHPFKSSRGNNFMTHLTKPYTMYYPRPLEMLIWTSNRKVEHVYVFQPSIIAPNNTGSQHVHAISLVTEKWRDHIVVPNSTICPHMIQAPSVFT